MPDQFRPLSGDPSGDQILQLFDAQSDEWLMSASGDYQTAAVEAFKSDGSNYQQVVALEWPARVNNSDERRTVRMMMSAEDAVGLAEVLDHTGKWLMEWKRRQSAE